MCCTDITWNQVRLYSSSIEEKNAHKGTREIYTGKLQLQLTLRIRLRMNEYWNLHQLMALAQKHLYKKGNKTLSYLRLVHR